MKKYILNKSVLGKTSKRVQLARTGEHCPTNGWWMPAGVDGVRLFIAEGSIMPMDKGNTVSWTLVATSLVDFNQGLAALK